MPKKFKIGDRIKIVKSEFILDHQDKKIGDGVIVMIDGEDEDRYYTFQNGYKNFYCDDHLELVEESKTAKFKIGDLVKISIPRDNKDWKLNGVVGEIEAIYDGENYPISVKIEEFPAEYDGTNRLQFKEEELELIPLLHN